MRTQKKEITMQSKKITDFIQSVLNNMPSDWLKLTTHRLDTYNEKLAKVEFLEKFEKLYLDNHFNKETLEALPTAFDYIRLGHPLSCILEWFVSKLTNLDEENVISFSSQVMPILAILRKNSLDGISTQIVCEKELPKCFDAQTLRNIYKYQFELIQKETPNYLGSTIVLTSFDEVSEIELHGELDFVVGIHSELGSITLVNGEKNKRYISEIQHVRRRESIAMTPNDCFNVLKEMIGESHTLIDSNLFQTNKSATLKTIQNITNTSTDASIGSSGLSVQYAIMMGLVHYSFDKHKGKAIKFIVPPNCYGGTNDQARRVAACIENVEVVDLPVDGGQDMVQSVEKILDEVSLEGAVPFIIAEIPTNPRVEVPDLEKLRDALSKKRENSIDPVFILDQTFCPNKSFLADGDILSSIKTISYVSGSKFPSGGLCTAGYCVSNKVADEYMSYIEKHLELCDNTATAFQMETLSKQMPSMLQRIKSAYENTRSFVNFIQETLPEAKINFVSEELAKVGFTPSVFSLDLPTLGSTHEEKEIYKRELNLKLIKMMINEIPHESKHCVSYGQLKGCYWTIPATSTQGTTREGDKDYIVRVAISPDFDLELHKKVFKNFCKLHIKE